MRWKRHYRPSSKAVTSSANPQFTLSSNFFYGWFALKVVKDCSYALSLLVLLALLTAQAQVTTIPNGRRITPTGDWIPVAPFPFSLAIRPDGQQLVAPSLGFPFALNVIRHPGGADRKVTQIPRGFLSAPSVEVYARVAYSPDDDSQKIRKNFQKRQAPASGKTTTSTNPQ